MELSDYGGHLSGQIACIHGHCGRLDPPMHATFTNAGSDSKHGTYQAGYFYHSFATSIIDCFVNGKMRTNTVLVAENPP